MIAFIAVIFLTIPQAHHAIIVDAQLDHPTHAHVSHCHRLSKRAIRCTLTEEVITTPTTPTGIGVIEIMEGKVVATHEHSYIRVHRE